MARWIWIALLLALPLLGCPSDDDDSAADDDDASPVGEPPVIGSVNACEIPVALDDCGGQADIFTFVMQFDIAVDDPDGTLGVGWHWFLTIDLPPPLDGVVKGPDVPVVMSVTTCQRWERNSEVPYEAWARDSDGNESERFNGTFIVPSQPGAGDCP